MKNKINTFMKLMLFLLSITLSNYSYSQDTLAQKFSTFDGNYFDIVEELDTFFDDTVNIRLFETQFKEYERWKYIAGPRIEASGSLIGAQVAMLTFLQNTVTGGGSGTAIPSNCHVTSFWKQLGPFSKPEIGGLANGVGRVNALWVNPSNLNHVLAGSNTGGLFKTTDALSSNPNWECLTPSNDESINYGVQGIAVDPNDVDKIYIATGTEGGGSFYGFGVKFSSDGGQTWTQSALEFDQTQKRPAFRIVTHPTQSSLAYVITKNQLFRLTNDGANMIDIVSLAGYTLPSDVIFTDLKFNPSNPDELYVSGNYLFKISSVNSSTPSWNNITSDLSVFSSPKSALLDEEFDLYNTTFSYWWQDYLTLPWSQANIGGDNVAQCIPDLPGKQLFNWIRGVNPEEEAVLTFDCGLPSGTYLEIYIVNGHPDNFDDHELIYSTAVPGSHSLNLTIPKFKEYKSSYSGFLIVASSDGTYNGIDPLWVDDMNLHGKNTNYKVTDINLGTTSTDIYCLTIHGGSFYIDYRLHTSSLAFTNLYNDDNSNFLVRYKNVLEPSQNVSNKVYFGGLNGFYRNPDNTDGQMPTHDDWRDLVVMDNGSNDVVYIACDGGLYISQNSGVTTEDHSGTGLTITQFYGVGQSSDGKVVFGGAQDLAQFTYNTPTSSLMWKHQGEKTDGGDGIGNPNDADELAFQYWWQLSGNGQPVGYVTYSDNKGNSEAGELYGFGGERINILPWSYQQKLGSYDRLLVGKNQVYAYNTPITSTAPYQLGTIDPLMISGNVATNKMKAICVAPSNPDVIYVAYYWPLYKNPDLDYPDQRKFFKSVDGGNTWDDITLDFKLPNPSNPSVYDKLYDWQYIMDIAVDPIDPNNVFVVMSGLVADKKVFQSTNGGNSWINITGLLEDNGTNNGYAVNFPIQSIEVTRDRGELEIFIGTDVGVYYRNPSRCNGDWVYFNEEDANNNNIFPKVIVTDMEYNSAAKKLRVSTYGRGMWESCLPCLEGDVSSTMPAPKNYNSGASTITGDNYPGSDIIVHNGATVTVTGTIYMPWEGQIIVEPGGVLIVDGGTITRSCGNLWKGILVQGSGNSFPQDDAGTPAGVSSHGIVKLINGATIEYSRRGIDVGWLGYTDGGGVVFASNSTFKNNYFAVTYVAYEDPNNPTHNYGYFENCDFINDEILDYTSTYSRRFISMWNVQGIQIKGCKFANLSDEFDQNNEKGIGVSASDATFVIEPAGPLTGPGVPCPKPTGRHSSFINLDKGVVFYGSSNSTRDSRHFKVLGTGGENGEPEFLNVTHCIDMSTNLSGGGALRTYESMIWNNISIMDENYQPSSNFTYIDPAFVISDDMNNFTISFNDVVWNADYTTIGTHYGIKVSNTPLTTSRKEDIHSNIFERNADINDNFPQFDIIGNDFSNDWEDVTMNCNTYDRLTIGINANAGATKTSPLRNYAGSDIGNTFYNYTCGGSLSIWEVFNDPSNSVLVYQGAETVCFNSNVSKVPSYLDNCPVMNSDYVYCPEGGGQGEGFVIKNNENNDFNKALELVNRGEDATAIVRTLGVNEQKLLNIIINARKQGRGIYSLTEEELIILGSLSETLGDAGDFVNGLLYNKKLSKLNTGKTKAIENSKLAANGVFDIYPNPTSSVVRFDYKFSVPTKNAEIVITDAQGKEIIRRVLPNESSSIDIDISAFASGLYHCIIYNNGAVVHNDKIALIK